MATLGAIVALALFGSGGVDLAIMTGLVGVLGTFRPSKSGPSGTPTDPVSVEPQ